MDKIYLILHVYTVDGGFGDAIWVEDFIGSFTDKNKAYQYVNDNSHPLIYDKPYNYLQFGKLVVKEIELNSVVPVDKRRFVGEWNIDRVREWNPDWDGNV